MFDTRKAFGEKVRYFRNRRHWKQGVLAERSRLSQGDISKIETGSLPKDPNKELIERLADALEIPPGFLVAGTPLSSLFGQSESFALGPKDSANPLMAYFASALTGLNPKQRKELWALDEKVHQVCNSYDSYPLVLYRPRTKTDPVENRDIPARKVYEIDQEHVATADLLILAAIFPSLGAGMELQLAYQACTCVILIKKKDQELSRMVLGCPVRLEIVEYTDLSDLESELRAAIDKLLPDLTATRAMHRQSPNAPAEYELGQRIREMRDKRKLSLEELARRIGVAPAAIEELESESRSEQINNPSLRMLRRMAVALDTSETYLISGHVPPIHSTNPIFEVHREALDNYAREVDMPFSDCDVLWTEHVEIYQYELSIVGADKRTEIGDRKYWVEKYERLKEKQHKGPGLFS
jgi:transcriptional regulator with XRE-family HTH domain